MGENTVRAALKNVPRLIFRPDRSGPRPDSGPGNEKAVAKKLKKQYNEKCDAFAAFRKSTIMRSDPADNILLKAVGL